MQRGKATFPCSSFRHSWNGGPRNSDPMATSGNDVETTGNNGKWQPVVVLTTSHALVDLCQGMVPALLPFLVADLDFTYAAGAGLVFATSAASSIIQPIFGHAADRWSFRWLLPVSL